MSSIVLSSAFASFFHPSTSHFLLSWRERVPTEVWWVTVRRWREVEGEVDPGSLSPSSLQRSLSSTRDKYFILLFLIRFSFSFFLLLPLLLLHFLIFLLLLLLLFLLLLFLFFLFLLPTASPSLLLLLLLLLF